MLWEKMFISLMVVHARRSNAIVSGLRLGTSFESFERVLRADVKYLMRAPYIAINPIPMYAQMMDVNRCGK